MPGIRPGMNASRGMMPGIASENACRVKDRKSCFPSRQGSHLEASFSVSWRINRMASSKMADVPDITPAI